MVHRIRSQDILRDGYTVISNVVPSSLIEPAIEAMFWHDAPGQQDREPGPPANLSPLGRKLIGLECWE